MSASTVALDLKGTLRGGEFVQTATLLLVIVFGIRFLFETLSSRKSKERRRDKLVDLLPGPLKLPLVQICPELIRVALSPKRALLPWLSSMKEKHGPIFKFWFGRPQVIIACAETAFELLKNDQLSTKASYVVEFAKQIGGVGVLTLPPSMHTNRRKMWLPTFSRKQIEHSIKFFRQEGVKLLDKLEQYAGDDKKEGKAFDMLELSIECTFRAICYSAFGEQYMDQLPDSVGREHMHDLHILSVNLTERTFRPWLSNDFIFYKCTSIGRSTKQSIDRANDFTRMAVSERRKQRKEIMSAKDNMFKNESESNVTSFLDNLLDLFEGGYLTEEEVLNEINTFVVAGYDTSGITICYVLYHLALYPEHQEKVLQELYEVLQLSPSDSDPVKNFEVTSAHTKHMKYMELCIKESMRLYPVAPISLRRTCNDVTLPDGRIIPEGVDVGVMTTAFHRDPKYFPEPNQYRPERHTERCKVLLPFSLGERNCIGQVYAIYEMKIVLSYLLLEYKWETTAEPNLQPIFQGLQAPENGLEFRVTKRAKREDEAREE